MRNVPTRLIAWPDSPPTSGPTCPEAELPVRRMTTSGILVANAHVIRIAELVAADESKDEFMAILAHELRNHLAPIRSAAEVLASAGMTTASRAKAQVILTRQIENMTRIIDDLLDVARITQRKIELRMAPIELSDILRRSLDVVDPQLRQRGQQVVLSLPREPFYMSGDGTRLEQAFGNLLNNASKFTSQGGCFWLTAERREANGHSGEFVVRVRDGGAGISPEMLPHVFDMFKQGTASPHQAPGLGVGLALVRRIIELHGGRVSALSAGLHRGSEFTVSLPLLPV